MFDKLKNLFGTKEVPAKGLPKPKKTPKMPKVQAPKQPELSEKDKATLAGEPYVAILKVDVDPSDINNGSFELDWNDKFLANLIRAGYKQKATDTDELIVERWFQTTCRNIALEVYEQKAADLTNRDVRPVHTRDLGDGRTEVS